MRQLLYSFKFSCTFADDTKLIQQRHPRYAEQYRPSTKVGRGVADGIQHRQMRSDACGISQPAPPLLSWEQWPSKRKQRRKSLDHDQQIAQNIIAMCSRSKKQDTSGPHQKYKLPWSSTRIYRLYCTRDSTSGKLNPDWIRIDLDTMFTKNRGHSQKLAISQLGLDTRKHFYSQRVEHTSRERHSIPRFLFTSRRTWITYTVNPA